MRNIVLTIAACSVLALSACAETAEEPVVVDGEMADTDPVAMAGTDLVLNANTATAQELGAVEGVSPDLADAIVAGRPYAGPSDLNTVLIEAAGDDTATALLTTIFVPVDLNEADREDIALIPGMTDRMIGEFLEYRPYEDMGEFDREIGKYVDAEEVARFRRYVTL